MKWNQCRRNRKRLCLLAGGVLLKEEVSEVEAHLNDCAECQKYFRELKAVATPLAGWEKHFTHIESSVTVQSLLSERISASTKPSRSFAPQTILLACWRQLIWPSRRIWTGLAAAWLFIVVANYSFHADAPRAATAAPTRSPDLLRAVREQQQLMAELIERPRVKAVEANKPTAPQPRSDLRNELLNAQNV